MGCAACNKPNMQARLQGDALCYMTTEAIKQRLVPLKLKELLEVCKAHYSNTAHLHFKTAESASAFYNRHAGKRLPLTSVGFNVLPSLYCDGTVVIYAQRAVNFCLASSSMAPLSALVATPSAAPLVVPSVAPLVTPLVTPSVAPLVAPSVAPSVAP
ncbi:hypothetical protein G6F43_012287 [Rhizopus delemar]|nr:hypothetical protein G6F43_012287 [Rhizopus delemar]